MTKKSKKAIGDDYLVRLTNIKDKPLAPHCACQKVGGRWMVEKEDGGLYGFDPSTQMQKDIWLGSHREPGEKEKAMGRLRWYCFGCGTIQMP